MPPAGLRRRLRLSCSSDEEDQPPPPPHHQNEPPQLTSSAAVPPYPYPSEPLPVTDDDDEEDQPPPPPHHQNEPPQPASSAAVPPYPYPSEPLPVTSDDDEYIDVSDNLSPSPPPARQPEHNNRAPPPPPQAPPSSRGCPISQHLQRLGLSLKREWVDACAHGLHQSVPGFQNFDVETKAKLCFEQFLVSDMNFSGGGVLPENVASLHLVDLPGPYVLQVDEIVNIGNPLKIRYQKAPVGLKRCLKLSMTDGVQRVFGMEYRPIQALDALSPAGLKVVICNVHIRHGLLMLVPESLEVLGGLVEELDAARQRLVEEANKPPRGKRTRNGVVPPLVTRLALAAWPPNAVHAAGHTNSSHAAGHTNGSHAAGDTNDSTMDAPTPFRASEQGTTFSVSARNTRSVTTRTGSVSAEESTIPLRRDHSVVNPSSTVDFDAEEMPIDTASNSRESSIRNPLSDDFGVETLHINTVHFQRESREPETSIHNPSFEEALDEDIEMDSVHHGGGNHTSDATLLDKDVYMTNDGETHAPCPSSDANLNDDSINVVDEGNQPPILSGDREPPFSYLYSLYAKLATMKNTHHSVQGKVKCVLTGVKKFQFTDAYELKAFIDDGSLISEILIHPSVVQNGIGHSAKELSAALFSPDKEIVRNMKGKMKHFQHFLLNFEGIMLMEVRLGELPVALEMNQGCTQSDAWLLLRRLKTTPTSRTSQPAPSAGRISLHDSSPTRTSQHLSSIPIDVSD